MFIKLLTSGILAGLLSGLIAGLLQLIFVQPILTQTELYEMGKLVHFGEATKAMPVLSTKFDPLRDILSLGFTTLIYTAYAMILATLITISPDGGKLPTVRQGLVWGLAGFVCVHMAPAFSLAPDTPGSAAVELGERQIWWFAIVISTAVALWLMAFAKNYLYWLLSVVLLLAPHLIGAPQPTTFTGTAPPELSSLFAARSLGVGLIAWSVTSLSVVYFLKKENSS